jgi:hypothetical protein
MTKREREKGVSTVKLLRLQMLKHFYFRLSREKTVLRYDRYPVEINVSVYLCCVFNVTIFSWRVRTCVWIRVVPVT